MRVRHSGFALVVVLLAVGAMFALAIRSAVATRVSAIEVGAVRERVRAEREGRAAVVIALSGLLPIGEGIDASAGSDGGVDGAPPPAGGAAAPGEDGFELPEFLTNLIPELKEVNDKVKDDADKGSSGVVRIAQGASMLGSRPRATILGTLRRVGLPSRPVDVEIGDRVYAVELRDAAGLLNINEATRDSLVRYLEAVGLASSDVEDIADQIVDWRDRDSVPSTNGAEQEQYDREGIRCRNNAFESVEELRFLPSMTTAIFQRIKPDLCLGGGGRIHVGSASREVLLSLPGMSTDVADEILARRNSEPITEASLDEVIPRSTNRALRDLVRADPSGAIAVRVREREAETGRPLAMLVGVAMISDEGIRAVGVRAE